MDSSSSHVGSSGSPSLAPPSGPSDPSLETSSASSENFVDDLLRGFRTFLMGLPALAPLATKMEAAAALPQRAILAALRSLTDPITIAILLEEDFEAAATALVERLAQENDINLEELTQEERSKCARWLMVIGSYYADQEIS
jgi:hypothetical protein